MTTDNLTAYIGKRKRITTTVGSQAFHYSGIIISVSDTHIKISDEREGIVDIPIANALVRDYQ